MTLFLCKALSTANSPPDTEVLERARAPVVPAIEVPEVLRGCWDSHSQRQIRRFDVRVVLFMGPCYGRFDSVGSVLWAPILNMVYGFLCIRSRLGAHTRGPQENP